MSKELIDELRHEADHWARCATNCTNEIVKAAYTSRSDRIAAAAARIAELEVALRQMKSDLEQSAKGDGFTPNKPQATNAMMYASVCAALTPPTKEKP
jgi:hypothetical protein